MKGDNNNNNRRKKRKQSNGHDAPSGNSASGSNKLVPGHPWTGMVQAWPMLHWCPTTSGLLGMHPPLPHQALLAAAPGSASTTNFNPDYSILHVFGCRCYPNTTATSAHKLASRSLPCIFLGYPADTKGYRCYDPESRRVLTSRHVSFDESCFPFRLLTSPRPAGDIRAVPQPDPILMPVPVRSRPRHAPARRGQESAPAQRGHGSAATAADDMPANSAASPVAPTLAAVDASGP
jgi:hypothetical protein